MSRRIGFAGLVLAVAIAGSVYLYWSARAERVSGAIWYGYLEGEALDVGAAESGFLASLDVRRGEEVARGAPLFALDPTKARAELAARRATLARARAELADLERGERAEEIAVRRARLEAAEARLRDLEAELRRVRALVATEVLPDSALDDALTARDAAQAEVDALAREIAVAELPARELRIEAARARVAEAEAAVAEAEKRVADLSPRAAADAYVEDTFFLPGDWVPANATVVRLLPPGNRFVRFFVPETEIATIRPGEEVRVACDGCGAPFVARVEHIAREAEYTPPVIYTRTMRAKLVYRVEARPLGPSAPLRVGLPVEVTRR